MDNERVEKDLYDVAGQIAASISDNLNEENKTSLENWKNAFPDNRQLYEKIVSEKHKLQKRQEFQSYSLSVGWEKFLIKRRNRKQKRLYRLIASFAALFILSFGLGYYFYPKVTVFPNYSDIISIKPGNNQARLTLANGKTIDLTQHQGQLHIEGGLVKIKNQDHRLSYENKSNNNYQSSQAPKILYNEISVPRCGEYQLQLSDGTVVYLNSMTQLRYPVSFSQTNREVSLTGEAYFHVVRDTLHPFVVHTATHDITVLGTQFNIKTFQDETEASTTLVNGKVRIDGMQPDTSIVLKPNEQFIYDKQQQKFKVQQVDVSYSIAWKEGLFRFRDARLEEIMRTIERWYDVEIVYADPETKDYTFGLNFSRNETIDPILRIFQENGKIKITPEGKTLIITKGR